MFFIPMTAIIAIFVTAQISDIWWFENVTFYRQIGHIFLPLIETTYPFILIDQFVLQRIFN